MRTGRARRLVVLGIAGLLVALLVPATAAASVDPSVGDAASAVITKLPVRMELPSVKDDQHRTLWTWSKGRRGYTLSDWNSAWGYHTLTAWDLDTGASVAEVSLADPAPAFQYLPRNDVSNMVVDEEGGRLFIAASLSAPVALGPNVKNPQPWIDDRLNVVGPAAAGSVCTYVQSANPAHCFAGLNVVDAETLETQARIPLQTLRIDGGPSAPVLRAMTYVPAEGDAGTKVLAVVEDMQGAPVGNQAEMPRYYGAAVNYVVQFDIAAGRQDWALRLDACRGVREPRRNHPGALLLSYPATVFRRVAAQDTAVYVGCHGANQGGLVVRVPLDAAGQPAELPVTVGDPLAAAETAVQTVDPGALAGAAGRAESPEVFSGPERVFAMLSDAESGRVLMKVVDGLPGAEVWWVFDVAKRQFVGTIGIGQYESADTHAGLDRASGRLYVMTPDTGDGRGGLYLSDVRRTPLAQPLHFPEFPTTTDATISALTVESAEDGAWRRIYRRSPRPSPIIEVYEDRFPLAEDLEESSDYAGRTLDLDEAEGVTSVALDGAARGYGFRALLVGGVEAAARLGPLDPAGQVVHGQEVVRAQFGSEEPLGGLGVQLPVPVPCVDANRELVLGFVGPEGSAVVDAAGSRGAAQAVLMDTTTQADLEAPASRCSPRNWDDIWSVGLFGAPPAQEPRGGWPFGRSHASCMSSSGESSERSGDPYMDAFVSQVDCDSTEASGHSYARGSSVDGLSVMEALSSFRIYRDPARGIVSRVESVARGVALPGIFRIDTVRGMTESWANGRRQPIADNERDEDYDASCDYERTAGTCFQRQLMGLRTPVYSCGPCGDEQQFVEALNRGLGTHGKAMFRQPDPELARGADNGFIAAVQKADHERFADLVLNNDLLQTVIPTLEIVRFASPNRVPWGGGPRGRQIYQFAGVEVSSSYGIACLLVYDAETKTCSEAPLPSGSLNVSLVDAAGEPLAGGAFEVRADTDADGVVGLLDELVGEGACVTAADGIGTCMFENLEPGSYLVSQTAAPPGYSAVAEPWVSEVTAGEARTVTFTNTSDVSVIGVSATDADGDPMEGATFAVFPDPDADGKVASNAQAAATCTTDASGVCAMEVPAGSYVLVQTVAPAGLEPIEPVAFAFASGGQTAAVGVTNTPAGAVTRDAPPSQASPVYAPPSAVAPPVESIRETGPTVHPAAPQVSVPERVGGTVTQVIRAPGDALRLLTRDPLQAVAWVASLMLFAVAAIAVRRRQQAVALLHHR